MSALGMFRQIFRTASPILKMNSFKARNLYFPQNMARQFCRQIQGTPEEKIQTMSYVRREMMARLGLEWDYSPLPKPRDHLLKYEPKLKDLPPRTMADSHTSAIIPLSKVSAIQNRYVTFLGHVRIGRLLEDMDLFAVWVCHKHLHIENFDPKIPLPYTFVTALVDNVDFTDYLPQQNRDIRLSGHVSWVGRSSMEVIVWLEQEQSGQWMKITQASFVMVARNAVNTKAAPVNPLKPGNEQEQKILAGGEERKKRRKRIVSESLTKVEPNDHEQKIIHDLFLQSIKEDHISLDKRVLPGNARWMEEGRLSNVIFSHPEHRNAQNKVFGGFLMRNALEVSWACAYMFCRRRPKLTHISDINFQKPVEVSSFIQMTAHVVYTELNYIQLITVADIFDPSSGEQYTTNTFYYTFSDNEPVAKVIPRTYHEAMWYLEGRRKLLSALKLV